MACLAVWMVWERRERARPVVDLYSAWEMAGYQVPESSPPTTVVMTRVLSENVVQVRDTNGVVWNVGLAGLGGVLTEGVAPRWRGFANETRTNLMVQLTGQPIQLVFTDAQPNHTGMGFFYLGSKSESLALDLVSRGRLRFLADSARMLPLTEQAQLKGADRKTRQDRVGLWSQSPEGDR